MLRCAKRTAARRIAVNDAREGGSGRWDKIGGNQPIIMARIYPFRALRYNSAHVSASDVVTQPYDKITPAMQQAYYQRSPYNLVRIILRLPELFDGEGDLYANAARDFQSWRASGVLVQERQPCVF